MCLGRPAILVSLFERIAAAALASVSAWMGLGSEVQADVSGSGIH
jgi:hypothetical protein